ncbi:GyrI-like domain-containing protein [Arcicella sp. DC2W]|uniref:GyrI-like domain-containing protein n=1 Tax=Arcicella gelida TaxID=2984195 RepID=A0ABU5SA67_9BACT|nr:GyrI-like domain-containing protein [Arcicella sp. DC2W]MEA5405370.1 GyrI-like domain-containing protein [Arcicella sp. DC2W]
MNTQVKEVPTQKYFIYRTETTLLNVNAIAMREIETLYATAGQLGLDTSAPLEFIYWGATGDVEKPFILEIALPVGDEEVTIPAHYELLEHPSFKAFAYTHHGDFSNIMPVYKELFNQLFAQGHKPTTQTREVYINWVDLTSSENVTEILLGIE